MSSPIYLAIINNCYVVSPEKLQADLANCIPHPISPIAIDIDLDLFYSGERNQYYSTLILSQLLTLFPKGGLKIVGVTNVDIYIPILTFLFGEAQLNGEAALVSTYRLHNEFYGLPADKKLFYQRVLKEILHELGHNFGLIHCSDYQCVMNSSTYVEDIDLKQPRFCPGCAAAAGFTCPGEQ